MNPYLVCLKSLGLDTEPTGEAAWLAALLEMGAELNLSTTDNPYSYVADDLANRINARVAARVRQMLNTHIDRYQRGL